MAIIYRDYTFKALTDVWTGSINKKDVWTGSINKKNEKLVTTGLIGSIRWWFEVLVRGLGGNACDPSSTECSAEKHCFVCELFGCTSWARKFRFEVLDENKNVQTKPITERTKFVFRFTELRTIRNEEWALLDATLHLLSEYGAIGGKTVLKPSDENNKNQHKDYGLIKIEKTPPFEKIKIDQLKVYLEKFKCTEFVDKDFNWASLQNFWFVSGKYLSRHDSNNSIYNKVLGRKEPKNQAQQLINGNNTINPWLAGEQKESKKVFSYKNPPRTFGFVKPDLVDFNEMKCRLRSVWSDFNDEQFIEGSAIVNKLLEKEKCL